MPESYADLVARLAAIRAAQAAEQAEVETWYEGQCAAARAAVERAEQQVAVAASAVVRAQAAVGFTDAEVGRIWLVLGGRLKVPDPAWLGPPPQPDVEAPDDGGPREPAGRLLDHARELLDAVTPIPRRHRVAPLLGALVLLILLALLAVLLVVRRH
jgi:hypothetical protein